jgi:hypothetical protein
MGRQNCRTLGSENASIGTQACDSQGWQVPIDQARRNRVASGSHALRVDFLP